MKRRCSIWAGGCLAGAAFTPRTGLACAACFGQSDSAMAAGMNWGILSLLVMIVFVLGGIAGFFVFLARRAAALSAAKPATLNEQSPESSIASEGAKDFVANALPYRSTLKRSAVLAQPPHRCAPIRPTNRVTAPRKRT